MRTLKTNVIVSHRTHPTEEFEAGTPESEVPAWALGSLGDHCWDGDKDERPDPKTRAADTQFEGSTQCARCHWWIAEPVEDNHSAEDCDAYGGKDPAPATVDGDSVPTDGSAGESNGEAQPSADEANGEGTTDPAGESHAGDTGNAEGADNDPVSTPDAGETKPQPKKKSARKSK